LRKPPENSTSSLPWVQQGVHFFQDYHNILKPFFFNVLVSSPHYVDFQKGSGQGFPIMVPCRHFLAYTQMLEVTLLKPCFVDYAFLSFTSLQALAKDPSSTVF